MAEELEGCSVSCKLSLDDLQAVCRQERLHCKQLRVNKHNIDDYEVEYLCDYKKSKEQEFYLVKWKGYPESSNTWEPRKNLKCRKLMTQFHEDMECELRRQRRRTTCPKRLDKDVAWTLVQKAKLRKRLQCWEADLNKTRNHPGRIFVLNEVDLDGPPRDFTYITNYKIITSDEAEKRGHLYDRQGATYLFDLDYVEDVYTVDAANHGNISHFVNHSCNPNLQVYNVFIDNLDQRLPRIALFSTRSIRAGEELTFDYKMQIDPVDAESTRMDSNFSLAGLPSSPKKRIRVECRCGSDTCRKYLF